MAVVRLTPSRIPSWLIQFSSFSILRPVKASTTAHERERSEMFFLFLFSCGRPLISYRSQLLLETTELSILFLIQWHVHFYSVVSTTARSCGSDSGFPGREYGIEHRCRFVTSIFFCPGSFAVLVGKLDFDPSVMEKVQYMTHSGNSSDVLGLD